MFKQAHVIHGCGKLDVHCAIATGMPLTSLTVTDLAFSRKYGYAHKKDTVKVIPW